MTTWKQPNSTVSWQMTTWKQPQFVDLYMITWLDYFVIYNTFSVKWCSLHLLLSYCRPITREDAWKVLPPSRVSQRTLSSFRHLHRVNCYTIVFFWVSSTSFHLIVVWVQENLLHFTQFCWINSVCLQWMISERLIILWCVSKTVMVQKLI